MRALHFKFWRGLKTAKLCNCGEGALLLLFLKGLMLELDKALYIKLLHSCNVGVRELNIKPKELIFDYSKE